MPTINTVRVIHHPTDGLEMEVIKEFFCYLGILFYDAPINSADDFSKELLNLRHKANIDIILNCSEELERIPLEYLNLVKDSTMVIKTLRKENNNKSFIIYSDAFKKQCGPYTKGADYYYAIISHIIKAIFDLRARNAIYQMQEELESSMQIQMEKFLDLMIEHNIFEFMQYKHTFRVLGMVYLDEPLYISNGVDPTGKFNNLMLKKLIDLNNVLGDREKLSGKNYLLYAKANTIQKIKEITRLMKTQPNIENLKKTIEISLSDHLGLIRNIVDSGTVHIGTMLLGATICENAESYQNFAQYYYDKLTAYVSTYTPDKRPVFYSLFYYQYGRYLDCIFHNRDYAAIYYQKAASLDPRGYQTKFRLGAYFMQKNHISLAKQYLRESFEIIYHGHNLDKNYNCLSTEVIIYTFKISLLLAKVYASYGLIQEHRYYLNNGEDVIKTFENIVDRIKLEYCLENDKPKEVEQKDLKKKWNSHNEIKSNKETFFNQWNIAHQSGTPLKVLKKVLQISKDAPGDR